MKYSFQFLSRISFSILFGFIANIVHADGEAHRILGIEIGMTSEEVLSILKKGGATESGMLQTGVTKPHFDYNLRTGPNAEAEVAKKSKVGDRNARCLSNVYISKRGDGTEALTTRIAIDFVEAPQSNTSIAYQIRVEKEVKQEQRKIVAAQIGEFLTRSYGEGKKSGSQSKPYYSWEIDEGTFLGWRSDLNFYYISNNELRDNLKKSLKEFITKEAERRIEKTIPKLDF